MKDTSLRPPEDASSCIDGTRSIPRPRRRLYVASLVGAFLVTVGIGLLAGGIEGTSRRMGVRDAPIVAELVAWLGRVSRDPLWLGLGVGIVVFLSLLALKGLLDRILKLLIGLNVVWLVVFLLAGVLSWAALLRFLGAVRPAG